MPPKEDLMITTNLDASSAVTRHFRTLSPLYSPLNVSLGIDQSSKKYCDMLAKLPEHNDNFVVIHTPQADNHYDYDQIDIDSRDNRLLLWQSPKIPELKIHVFPNHIAVAELALSYTDDLSASEVQKCCQRETLAKLTEAYQSFSDDLMQAVEHEHEDLLHGEKLEATLNLHWISRTYIASKSDLSNVKNQHFITQWLKDTQRPQDARDIIQGKTRHSMTWLNYAVVMATNPEAVAHCSESSSQGNHDVSAVVLNENLREGCEPLNNKHDNYESYIDTMILAQYYYTAQEKCNQLLKQAIDSAYSSSNLSVAEKQLSTSRVLSRLHQIDFHEHQKYLNRFKRRLLNDILTCWDFEQLTENGLRMIEICSSRLQEADNKKRERSTIMTDLLLVTLSFFAVFELSLYLTELSREMMSRPALAYNDENSSFFLQLIAGIDIDIMFIFGFGLTMALILIYKRIKSK